MKKIFLSQQIVTNHRQCIPHINWNEILLCNYSYLDLLSLDVLDYLDLLSLDVLDLFLDCNYLVRFYIYIYLNLNPTIEIVKASKHFLNATEWTNCFRRNYLFHIVVKSLTRILYRSMPSGDICRNEKWEKTSDAILLYLLFRFSFTWRLYFNLKHQTLNVCYILWPELIVWSKCLSF